MGFQQTTCLWYYFPSFSNSEPVLAACTYQLSYRVKPSYYCTSSFLYSRKRFISAVFKGCSFCDRSVKNVVTASGFFAILMSSTKAECVGNSNNWAFYQKYQSKKSNCKKSKNLQVIKIFYKQIHVLKVFINNSKNSKKIHNNKFSS